jgi:putative ABC transport system permease protein
VARAAVTLIAAYGPPDIPRLRDAAPDGTALLFAIAAACASAFLFGTLPALRAGRVPPGDVLRDGRTGGNTSRRLHRWLAGSEAAVTVTLLVIASLLFESLVKMQQVEPGFTPDHVYAADVSLPRASYAEPARREAFFSDLLRRLGEEPGIGHVGATSYLPMSGSNYGFFFFVEGQPHLGTGRDPVIAVRHVSADYFRTMKIPVRRGRAFTDADAGGALPVAIINETAARKFFPNVDPVGRHLANSTDAIMREIVGVVGDVRFNGPTRPDPEELYLPYRQMPWPSMSIVISSSLGGDAVAAVVRRDVARIDPDQAVADIRPMQRLVAASTTEQQFVASLIGLFAVLAIALAAIGVYGVISLFVAQRRQEFGVRMALGAQRSDVMLLVLREGAWMTLGGAALGLAAAAAASRALGHLLFGVSATEPSAYVAGTLALVLVGLAASYFPARRAMSTEPAQALRSE